MRTIAGQEVMNKKERRAAELERHYNALRKLYEQLNPGKTADGKRLSVKLLALERAGSRIMLARCNGEDPDEAKSDAELSRIEDAVFDLFGGYLDGFFLNGDPRGCCLKINDNLMRTTYAGIGLQQDWGGFGLLAPEITGD